MFLYNELKIKKTCYLQLPFGAKFSGATGNFNAHQVAYPEIDWKAFGTQFVESTIGTSLTLFPQLK